MTSKVSRSVELVTGFDRIGSVNGDPAFEARCVR